MQWERRFGSRPGGSGLAGAFTAFLAFIHIGISREEEKISLRDPTWFKTKTVCGIYDSYYIIIIRGTAGSRSNGTFLVSFVSVCVISSAVW